VLLGSDAVDREVIDKWVKWLAIPIGIPERSKDCFLQVAFALVCFSGSIASIQAAYIEPANCTVTLPSTGSKARG
jgi:hypothetical protein